MTLGTLDFRFIFGLSVLVLYCSKQKVERFKLNHGKSIDRSIGAIQR